MAKTKRFSKDMLKRIASEISEKVNTYENRMSYMLGRYTEMAELFLVRPGSQPENTFSNPRLSEMFRAVNIFSKMEYRMLTSYKPMFDIVPMTREAFSKPRDIAAMALYCESQLAQSNYYRGLLRALYSKNLMGTCFVEEPYEERIVNFLGRKAGVTQFKPRSLLQTAFADNSSDIDDAEWVTFSDYVSKQRLAGEMSANKENPSYYAYEELESEITNGKPLTTNEWVQQRLQAAGYQSDAKDICAREVTTYYGSLDCLNDNQQYYVKVLNRGCVFQISEVPGLRPVRVATYLDFELEPLGYGIGTLLGDQHRAMDANRRSLTDLVTFSAYNMMVTRKGAFDDSSLNIAPWGLIEAEEPSELRQLQPAPQAIAAVTNLGLMDQQEFRAAAGTPDIMQAMPTGETATEVALTSNASVRNISVTAEMSAPQYVKKHLQVVIENGQKFMDSPYTAVLNGRPVAIMPAHLMHDVDIVIRTNTDTNFRPNRIKNLMSVLSMLPSIPVPPGKKLDETVVTNLFQEVVRSMEVPADALFKDLSDKDLEAMALQQQLQQPAAAGSGRQAPATQEQIPEQLAGGTALAGTPAGTVITPEGEDLSGVPLDDIAQA